MTHRKGMTENGKTYSMQMEIKRNLEDRYSDKIGYKIKTVIRGKEDTT